ncbi:MAG: hypothetical protein CK426_08275 [Legionella sp.]|nr:MAG: hypothetical protein CK423_01180 [Legionella sp.]PJD97425.1 MAG: hypothetical protein CK426_08275 [Legionella sp.]
MMNKLLATLIFLFVPSLFFAATLSLKSATGDKSLDGQYEVHKINPLTWVTNDGKLTGHKMQTKKSEALLVNEAIYEGVQRIQKEGHLPVIIHFLGKIDSKNKERGIYTKMDPKTNQVIDHGTYEYSQ